MRVSLGVARDVNQPTATATHAKKRKAGAHHGSDVGDGVSKGRHLEHFGMLCDAMRAQEASVAPAYDGDAPRVDQGLLGGGGGVSLEGAGVARGGEHVVDVVLADVPGQAGCGTFWGW